MTQNLLPRAAGRCSLWGVLGLLGIVGCGHTWDTVTSRDFKMRDLWSTPDPVVVLRESSDNYKRARAYSALHEPLAHGGDQHTQDYYFNLLQQAAVKDLDPLCRLSAIRTLGTYKDPRAVKVLEAVFHQDLKFTGEINSHIKQQVLASLEQTGSPEAAQLFINVARQPAGTKESPVEAQRILDERLTAIRALAKFPQANTTETLVAILEKEKDVALRARANESLKTITKKDLDPDAKVWREYLATGRAPEPQGMFARVMPRPSTPGPVIQADGQNQAGFFQRMGEKMGVVPMSQDGIQQIQGTPPPTFPQ